MDNIEMLRVRNWTRFESYRTRRMRSIKLIRVPTNLENEGYVDLLSHENGAAHFGAWVAILRVAAQCNPRGTLVRNNGSAYTAASLARMTRMPEALFDDAIPRLLEIGWLETIVSGDKAKSADADAGICQADAPPANDMMAESDGTESERDCEAVPSKKEEVNR
jgi:hypothetical protein